MAEKNEFKVVREFNAPQDLIWKMNSEAEHLAKWWGPKDFKLAISKFEFKPGGIFLFSMESADGFKMWARFIYREIVPEEKIVFVLSFSDEHGGITRQPMSDNWPLETLNTVLLSESNGKTTLTVTGRPINATATEEQEFYNGFDDMNQGYNGTYDQLEEYLKQVKS